VETMIKPLAFDLNGSHPASPRLQSAPQWIDPTTAGAWLEECRFPKQRKLRGWHVDRLAHALISGEFEPGTLVFHHVNGDAYLTDGQHRLAAIHKSGIGTTMVVSRWLGSNMERASASYFRTDQGAKRSYGDVTRCSDVSGEYGLSDFQVGQISGAGMLVEIGFTRGNTVNERLYLASPDNRVKAAAKWADTGRLYYDLLKGCDAELSKRLCKRAVMAAALVTLDDCPDLARRFWSEVAGNDGLARHSPQQALVLMLMSGRRGSPGGSGIATEARCIAKCWNAFVQGRTLGQVKVYDNTLPFQLLKTRFK
jgi:hypothetical protein